MLPFKTRFANVGLLIVLGALLTFTVISWADPQTMLGGKVSSSNVSLDLDPVTYDLSTGDVSGVLRFRDTNGINSVSGTPSFYVLRIDPSTDEITAASVTPMLSYEDSNTLKWDFSYTVPSGLKFFGCRLEGTYLDGSSGSRSLDSKIGGWVDFSQFP